MARPTKADLRICTFTDPNGGAVSYAYFHEFISVSNSSKEYGVPLIIMMAVLEDELGNVIQTNSDNIKFDIDTTSYVVNMLTQSVTGLVPQRNDIVVYNPVVKIRLYLSLSGDIISYASVPGTMADIATGMKAAYDAEVIAAPAGHWALDIGSMSDNVTKISTVGYAGEKEETDIELVADVNGSLGGKSFKFNTVDINYYVWFRTTGVPEITDVTLVADVGGNKGGKSFNFNTPNRLYYVWFRTTGIVSQTDFTMVADVKGSLGGKSFFFDTKTLKYYVWFKTTGYKEKTDLTCLGDVAGSLNSKYFFFDTMTTKYCVWYNVSGGSIPIIMPGRTSIEVDIITNDVANSVATATRLALTAQSVIDGTFAITGATSHCIIQNSVIGLVSHVVDYGTGFTITLTDSGIGVGIDPLHPGRTGIEVDITSDDVANTIATACRAALNTRAGIDGTFVRSGATSHAIVTNVVAGLVASSVDVNSGVTVTINAPGVERGSDPLTSGRTGIMVDITTNDVINTVATAARNAMDIVGTADGTFTISGGTSHSIITNVLSGNVTNAVDVNSGVTFSITPGVSTGIDPAHAGRTGIVVDIATDDIDTAVATATRDALNTQAGIDGTFVRTGATTHAIITNVKYGAVVDTVDVDSGVTITKSQNGVNGVVNTIICSVIVP